MIKLLIFDLDGTLIHSAPDIITTTNKLLVNRNHPPLSDEVITAAIGEGVKQLLFSLFKETLPHPEEIKRLEDEFTSTYEENLIVKTKPYPGVESFLEKCPYKIAIVTNKSKRFTDKILPGLKLDRFPWVRVFSADSLPNRKPDPLPLLEAAKAAGAQPHEAIMIGDGIPDMIAARRAGMHAIGIRFGYTKPEILQAQGATDFIDSYDELAAKVEEMANLPPREVMPS